MPSGLSAQRYTQACIDIAAQRQDNRHQPFPTNARAAVGSHKMHRIGGIALVLCFIFFITFKSWCEPAAEKTTQCESSVKSKPSNPWLLGRSEMQEPKPLPVIRLLRLQEIPMAVCAQDLRESLVDARNPSGSVRTGEQRPEPVAPRATVPGINTRGGQ